jgi:hypothetical protein
MFRSLGNFYGVLVMAFLGACTRYVCPTYQSALQPKPQTPHTFFAYFNPKAQDNGAGTLPPDSFDSLIEEEEQPQPEVPLKNAHGLLVFAEGEEPSLYSTRRNTVVNKNGVHVRKTNMGMVLRGKIPDRKSNYPRLVSTKNPRPFPPSGLAEDDSTVQLLIAKLPPPNFDQLFYDIGFGPKEQAATDSLAEPEEDPEAGLTFAEQPLVNDAPVAEESGKKGKKGKKEGKGKKDKKNRKEKKSDAADPAKPAKKKKKKKDKNDQPGYPTDGNEPLEEDTIP